MWSGVDLCVCFYHVSGVVYALVLVYFFVFAPLSGHFFWKQPILDLNQRHFVPLGYSQIVSVSQGVPRRHEKSIIITIK